MIRAHHGPDQYERLSSIVERREHETAWQSLRRILMNQDLSSLNSILDRTWGDLSKATGEPRHPYRLGQFATVVAGRGVDVRTVVLRQVDRGKRQLRFFADGRSEKIAEIATDSRVAWVFYDPMLRVQLRWWGQATAVMDGAVVDDAWAGLNATQREEFTCTASPGTILGEGWDRPETPPKRLALDEARKWFCVVEVTVQRLDWLMLDAAGHMRARFELGDGAEPAASWVVP